MRKTYLVPGFSINFLDPNFFGKGMSCSTTVLGGFLIEVLVFE